MHPRRGEAILGRLAAHHAAGDLIEVILLGSLDRVLGDLV